MLILAAIFVLIPLLIVICRGLSDRQLMINAFLTIFVAPIGAIFALAGAAFGDIGASAAIFTVSIPFIHALYAPNHADVAEKGSEY